MKKLRVALAGVGNNASALVQGIEFYRVLGRQGVSAAAWPGIRSLTLGGFEVTDIEFSAAFDVNEDKVGKSLSEAIFVLPNNYVDLSVPKLANAPVVLEGLRGAARDERGWNEEVFSDDERLVSQALKETGSEVLLYQLPTGLPSLARAYARAALNAGAAFINCTPDPVVSLPAAHKAFIEAGVPCIGDDLASHLGTSIVHRSLLALVEERGLTLESSYQLNFGGNEDFRNLRENGGAKAKSKQAALRGHGKDKVEVIPSAGYIASLKDRKSALVNIAARGWGGTDIRLELRLDVQDSSNAAGVIIDLLRLAGAARRQGRSGFVPEAESLLKAPPAVENWGSR